MTSLSIEQPRLQRPSSATPGLLVYVVGPSGAGKDSVLAGLRNSPDADHRIVIAQRYITRPRQIGGERHVPLSEQAFLQHDQAGSFAMTWEGHGLHYGIGIEIEGWLKHGLTVLVNGSRAHLPEARRRFPDLKAVCISATPEIIATRLGRRRRESPEEVAERLHRNSALAAPRVHKSIVNDGALDDAVGELADWLRDQLTRTSAQQHGNSFRRGLLRAVG